MLRHRNSLTQGSPSLPQQSYEQSSISAVGGASLGAGACGMPLWQPESRDRQTLQELDFAPCPPFKPIGAGFSQQLCDEYHLGGLPDPKCVA